MSWHYQVMKHDDGQEVWYGVHWYYTCGDGLAVGWTESPIISAETLEKLKQIPKMLEQDIYKHGVKDYK